MEVANKLRQLFQLGFKYLKFSLILIDSLLVLWWEGKPHPSGTPLGYSSNKKDLQHTGKTMSNSNNRP